MRQELLQQQMNVGQLSNSMPIIGLFSLLLQKAASSPAPYTDIFAIDMRTAFWQPRRMNKPLLVCGRVFTPEFIEQLNLLQQQDPPLSKNELARVVCQRLAWFSPDGRPAISSASVALRKLRHRSLIHGLDSQPKRPRTHRLQPSTQPLPAVCEVPARVDQVRGLHLYLLSGYEDPLHSLWNDLMIKQHPCADAPLVGSQLRYLIGSEHGWLGAMGFASAAFVLSARDVWIGWSSAARLHHLHQVVGLARFLIRKEVRCTHLASKALSLVLNRLSQDWQNRYSVEPVLVETFVDRSCFTGRCFAAANWLRIGSSTGRGRLGASTASLSLKDIWLYPLQPKARQILQEEASPVLTPIPLVESFAKESWCTSELATLELGDQRRQRRAEAILQARWAQPQASFYGSFDSWAAAKGAYGLIEHSSAPLSLESLLAPHSEATQARMAAEPVVLMPQDTTTLNYTGLCQTTGLGPLGEASGRGLWLHSLLAYRPDGVALGVLHARSWAREQPDPADKRGRNAKSIDEKESGRWINALRVGASAGRRMPQTQLVVITDREGDLYELHDAVQTGPDNLHTLIRAQHDRYLEGHQKLWSSMAQLPPGDTCRIELPRRKGQSARTATLEIRWSAISIESPKTGAKKGWPQLNLWAVWAHEPNPPHGIDPIDWMLLTDLPVRTATEAWEKVQWYRVRWGIEEWHRVLKSGCNVEGREFKTAEHLQRVLAFDLIVAWRVLASLKLGRIMPQLPASVIYTEEELAVLSAALKKKAWPAETFDAGRSQPTGGTVRRLCGAAS